MPIQLFTPKTSLFIQTNTSNPSSSIKGELIGFVNPINLIKQITPINPSTEAEKCYISSNSIGKGNNGNINCLNKVSNSKSLFDIIYNIGILIDSSLESKYESIKCIINNRIFKTDDFFD